MRPSDSRHHIHRDQSAPSHINDLRFSSARSRRSARPGEASFSQATVTWAKTVIPICAANAARSSGTPRVRRASASAPRKSGRLRPFPLLKRGCCRDHCLPGLGERAVGLEQRADRPEGPEQGVERRRLPWNLFERGKQRLQRHRLPVEQDFALVCEVPEEGAIRHARPGGDLGALVLSSPACRTSPPPPND